MKKKVNKLLGKSKNSKREQEKSTHKLIEHSELTDRIITLLQSSQHSAEEKEELSALLKECKCLNLSSYPNISTQDIDYLLKMLNTHCTLTVLDLSNHNIEKKQMRMLAEILAPNTTMKALYLNNTKINSDALSNFFFFGEVNDANNTLTTIGLANNNLTGEDIADLLENSTIKSLDLSNNNIGDSGAMIIAGSISIGTGRNTETSPKMPLKEVNLSNNNITDTGAQSIFVALAKNVKLRKLDLSKNIDISLDSRFCSTIGIPVRVLKDDNHTLMRLNLESTSMKEQTVSQLKEIITRNEKLFKEQKEQKKHTRELMESLFNIYYLSATFNLPRDITHTIIENILSLRNEAAERISFVELIESKREKLTSEPTLCK